MLKTILGWLLSVGAALIAIALALSAADLILVDGSLISGLLMLVSTLTAAIFAAIVNPGLRKRLSHIKQGRNTMIGVGSCFSIGLICLFSSSALNPNFARFKNLDDASANKSNSELYLPGANKPGPDDPPAKLSGSKTLLTFFECGDIAQNPQKPIRTTRDGFQQYEFSGIRPFGFQAVDTVTFGTPTETLVTVSAPVKDVIAKIELIYADKCKPSNDKVSECEFSPSDDYDENPHGLLKITSVTEGTALDCSPPEFF